MRVLVTICGVLFAAVLAFAPVSASAAPVSLLAPNGTFRVIYDDAQASLIGKNVTFGFEGLNDVVFHVDTNYAGVSDPDGPGNGILATIFEMHLDALFVPEPGYVFTPSLAMFDAGQVGFHHGFYGGEELLASTLISTLDNTSSQLVTIPALVNVPPWGQGGGGAYNAGIDLGTAVPPAFGFGVDMTQTIVLWDNSSLGLGGIVFQLQTEDAPAPAPVPEPGSLVLLSVGMLGFGRTIVDRG